MHGQTYQALSARAAAFHERFVQALATGGGAYAAAEAASVSPLQSALDLLNAPTQALLGRPLVGNGANGAPGTGANGGDGGILFGSGGPAGPERPAWRVATAGRRAVRQRRSRRSRRQRDGRCGRGGRERRAGGLLFGTAGAGGNGGLSLGLGVAGGAGGAGGSGGSDTAGHGGPVVPAACYSAPARTAQRPVATVGRAVSPGCSATAATVVTPELARPRATSAPAAPAACCSARTA
ncbi:hypothetical protein RN05_3888 [Mycobacterium tuberculosis]|nr:hypothetical protein RN05_3888 [Mycobacterium tuberculosis]